MVLRFLTGIKTKFSLQKKQTHKKKKKIEPAKKQTLQEMIEAARKREESQQDTGGNLMRPESTTKEIIPEAELQKAKSEIIDLNEKKKWLLTKTLHSVNLK